MGLLVGTFFYPIISTTPRHRLVVWVFRLVALPLAIILYVVLVRNFYTSNPYSGSSSSIFITRHPNTLRSLFLVPLPFLHTGFT